MHSAVPGVPTTKPEVWHAYVKARDEGKRTLQKHLLGQLIVIHEPLAMQFLNRFMSKWSQFGALPLEDMQQASRIGLMRALQTHDVLKGRFASWVHLWTRLELSKCAETWGVRTKKLPLDAEAYRCVVDFEIRSGRLAEEKDIPELERLRLVQFRLTKEREPTAKELPPITVAKLLDAQFKVHFTELTEDHEPEYCFDMESLIDERRVHDAFKDEDDAPAIEN